MRLKVVHKEYKLNDENYEDLNKKSYQILMLNHGTSLIKSMNNKEQVRLVKLMEKLPLLLVIIESNQNHCRLSSNFNDFDLIKCKHN